MGGEIKVVKKDGPGTLMRLYLLLSATADGTEQRCQVDFAKHSLVVSGFLSSEYYFKTLMQLSNTSSDITELCECRCCLHYAAAWVD
jgi:hypothetical protein